MNSITEAHEAYLAASRATADRQTIAQREAMPTVEIGLGRIFGGAL